MHAIRRWLRRVAAAVWFAERPKERRWRRAAERGDIQASYSLGRRYVEESRKYGRHGSIGIPLRPARRLHEASCRYLRLAADAGHGEAAFHLARQLAKGPNRRWWPDDDGHWPDEAKRYLTMAAESGHTHAAYLLGAMHLRSMTYASPEPTAERYLRQAAEAGHAKAAYTLGELLARQKGRETSAEHFLRLAADRDDPSPLACAELARLLIRTQRIGEAEPYLRAALNSRFGFHRLQIGWMELLGDVLTKTGRAPEAKIWYERAERQKAVDQMTEELPDD